MNVADTSFCRIMLLFRDVFGTEIPARLWFMAALERPDSSTMSSMVVPAGFLNSLGPVGFTYAV